MPSIPTIKDVRSYFGDKTAGLSDYDLANKMYDFLREKDKYRDVLADVDKPSFYALTGVNSDMGEFTKGFGAGVDNLQSSVGAGATMVGRAAGWKGLEGWGDEMRTGNLDEASQYIPKVSKVEDIGGVGDAKDWLVNQVGQQIPNIGTSLIGGVTGGIAGTAVAGPVGGLIGAGAGAFAPNLVLNAGDVYNGLVDKGIDPVKATKYAAAAGVAMGTLDTVLPMRVAGRVIGPKATSMITRAIMGQGENLARKVGVDAALEASTETAQTLIQNKAASMLGVGPSPEEAQSSLINSAAAGGVLGILGAGASHLAEPSRSPNMDKVNEILAKQKAAADAEKARTDAALDASLAGGMDERPIPTSVNVPSDPIVVTGDGDALLQKHLAVPGTIEAIAARSAERARQVQAREEQRRAAAVDIQSRALDAQLDGDMEGGRPMSTRAGSAPPLVVTPGGDVLTPEQAADPGIIKFAEAARQKTDQAQAAESALIDKARAVVTTLKPGAALNFKQVRNALQMQDAPAVRKVLVALEAEGLASKSPDGRWQFTGAPGTADEKPAPESATTLRYQQQALVEGRRPVQLFPTGTAEMALPEGMARVETPRGIFHYNPQTIDETTIAAKSAEGRENELLGLGPMTKAEIVASGEPQVAVIERAPDGAEVLAALSTEANAEALKADMATRAGQGHTITIEPADKVIEDRKLDAARARVNLNPTEGQKVAGNYAKAPIKFQGLDVAIENPKGSKRTGKDSKKKKWSVTMPADYGYVKRTEGADGDAVDVYVGPNHDAPMAFVVNQHNHNNGHFDEHKAMLGFASQAEAEAAYDAAFNDGKGPKRRKSVVAMPMGQFKDWIKNGDTTEAIPVPVTPERPQSLVEFMAEVGIDPKSKGIADLSRLIALKQWHRSAGGGGKSKTFDPERKKFRKRIFRDGGVSLDEFITRAEDYGFQLRDKEVTSGDTQAYSTQSVDLLNKLLDREMGQGAEAVRQEDQSTQEVHTAETAVDATQDQEHQSALQKRRNDLEREAEEFAIPDIEGLTDTQLEAEVEAMRAVEADEAAYEAARQASPDRIAKEYADAHEREEDKVRSTAGDEKAPDGGDRGQEGVADREVEGAQAADVGEPDAGSAREEPGNREQGEVAPAEEATESEATARKETGPGPSHLSSPGQPPGGETNRSHDQKVPAVIVGVKRAYSVTPSARLPFKVTDELARKVAVDIDRVARGEVVHGNTISLGRTPPVLRAVGFPSHPLVVNKSIVSKRAALHPDVPLDAIKQLPSLLHDPMMVLKSATRPGAVVVFVDKNDAAGDPILVSVDPASGTVQINRVSSLYGKKGFPGWVQDQVDAGRLMYLSKEKDRGRTWLETKGLRVRGVQFPTGSAQLDPYLAPTVLSEIDVIKRFGQPSEKAQFSVTPTERFTQHRAAIEKYILKTVQRMTGGKVAVNIEDELHGEGEYLIASGARGVERQEIGGYFQDGGPLNSLIALSLSPDFDTLANAAHEPYHYAKRYLIQPDENAIIGNDRSRVTLEALVRKAGLDPAEMTAEEVEAVAFGEWYAQREQNKNVPGLLPAVRRAWTRVADFMESIRYFLGGFGFKSLNDIFENLESGKMAARGARNVNAVTGEGYASESAAFRKWFGSSKAVDENGEPLKLYHGTTDTFDRFSPEKSRVIGSEYGSFFTPDPDVASRYAGYDENFPSSMPGGNVLPVYLSLQNPLIVDFKGAKYGRPEAVQKARDAGHDGVILRNHYDVGGVKDQYVAFSPSQIKSIFNAGTFADSDPRMAYSIARLKEEASPLLTGSGPTAREAERTRVEAAKGAQAQADFNAKKRDGKIKAKAPQEDAEGGLFDALPKRQGTLFTVTPAGTEAQRSVLSRIIAVPETEKPFRQRVRERIAEWKQGAAQRARQAIFDQFDAIKQLELGASDGKLRDASVSAYKATRMTRNINSQMAAVLRHGPIKWENGAPVPVAGFEGGFEGIFSDIAKRGELDLLKGWMVAKRADRLLGEGRENLLSQADIDTLLDVPAEMAERFQAASDKWQSFNGHVLDFAREAGVLNKEQVDLWTEHADYVPFYRLLDDDGEAKPVAPGTRGGISNQRSGIKGLKGGEQQINDPIENMVMSMARLIDASMKNEAMKRVADLAVDSDVMTKDNAALLEVTEDDIRARVSAVGMDYDAMSQDDKDRWGRMLRSMRQPGGSQVSVMVEGKPVYYTVNDAQLLSALTSFSPKQLGAIMGIFRGARQLLTRAVTLDPAFMARNFVRDTMSAWVTGGEKNFRPGYDSIRGFRKALKEDTSLVSIMAAGGPGAGYQDVDPKSVRKQVERRFKLIEGKGARVLNTAQKAFEAYERIGSASEMANRIAIYEAVKKSGGTNAEAAYQALDLMDFGMRGDSVAMRVLIETVPFMNARLQGLYKLWRGATEGDRAGKLVGINKYFLLHGLVLMAATMALAGANQGEDWYEDLEDWAKDGFYWFKVGDQVYSLPKPFEVGSIFSTIPERFMRAVSGRDTTKDSAKAALRMFTDTFAMNPTPQLIKPLVDVWANKDSFTGREIVPQRLDGLLPEAQYTADTSEVARMVGKVAKVSPLQIESLLHGYFGTLGTYVLDGADMMARNAMGLPQPADNGIYDIPAVGGVVRSFAPDMERRGTISVTKFYDLHRETEAVYKTFMVYQKRGDLEGAKALLNENRNTLEFRQGLNSAYKYMSNLTEEMRTVQNSTSMSPQIKRERLVQITSTRNALAKKIMAVAPATASLADQISRSPTAKKALLQASG